MFTVTVGIITYERSETIKKCLESVEKQTIKPDEIIVVDSSKTNKTKSIIEEKFPNVKYIRTAKIRVPQPTARNIILRKARGDIIAFIDDDVICNKYWLQEILRGYSFGSNIVGVTGPVILSDCNFNPMLRIIRKKKNQNFFTKYGDIRCKSWNWIPPEPVKCQIMAGGNMSFLREKLLEVGGFDEFYGRYPTAFREETDPQIALVKRGYSFMYMPGAFVYHVATSKGGISEFKRNSRYFYYCGKCHRYLSDKYFSKILSRVSWLCWSINPPCIWISIILSILRRQNYLEWHKGLWG